LDVERCSIGGVAQPKLYVGRCAKTLIPHTHVNRNLAIDLAPLRALLKDYAGWGQIDGRIRVLFRLGRGTLLHFFLRHDRHFHLHRRRAPRCN
jgi:hypothetical protein